MKTFTETEINKINNEKIKKNENYFNRGLIKCPVRGWNYSWKNKDAPRCFCIMDFIQWINKYNIQNVKILNITDNNDPELEFISSKKTNLYKYNSELNENDLHITNFDKCDFFIFNQTIEHLYNPFIALKNIYNSINNNGYIFTSVPSMCIPHNTPIHFGNYTPTGLAMLFLSVGFEILEIGFWGNRNYIINSFGINHDFPDIYKCNTFNEEKNVCGTWILAKKVI